MFGYVLPRKDRLTEPELARYRAAYCGLCRSLRLNYGFRARFLVNYDMTFLYFLLQDGAPEPERCFCPAHPFCRRECLDPDGPMAYAADLSVLLSYWKLCDAERDGRFFRKLAAKAAKRFYRRCYREACRRRPEADRAFAEGLARLHALEDRNCPSLDRPADAFAGLLRVCAAWRADEAERRATEQLLYHVGRYLYLTDALDDLPKDAGRYNPLRYRFRLAGGALSEADKRALLDTIEASVSLAASALELLPPSPSDGIRRNIIYYGLPTVLHSVAAGTFRKHQRGTKA